ncbi:MAG: citrate transporter, partial [Candidatus Eremiobacteraeota bacterium]|nr:citrate transporter [Candidatus Eremiobacteraeota bacterium]
MTGLLVVVVFLIFAALMYRRKMPAILAVPLMGLAMSLVAGVPFATVGPLLVTGASSLANVYVAVIFGALLGRVTIDTGIARAIVNLAAEYGGEQPFVLALVLCAVVALLFTSLSGLGAIIMVGSIVLPIMMTTGVPRRAAATLFLMAFALGFIFNIVNWKFYTQFFAVAPEAMTRYALVLAMIDAVALVLYAVVAFRGERSYATWAVRADRDEEGTLGVPPWALLTPVLPIVLYYSLHLDATLAFIVSALYGVLVTGVRKAIPTLVAAAIRGVEDVAPAILLFIGIGMLLTLTKAPQFAHALQPLVAGGWTRSPVAYVVVFGLLSPLVVYRGPLNPFGVGIAIFTVLL